jgi:hypothetical protein
VFRIGWERAGRPIAPTLCRAAYAVAMVHGMLGDEERRAAWVRVTIEIGTDPVALSDGVTAGPRRSTRCWPCIAVTWSRRAGV